MTEHILLPPTTKRAPSPWALALSFLLNLLFALLLVWVAIRWREEAEKLAREQQQVQVELVPQPQPQPQPQPKPQQQQQQQPEQKQEQKPEEKKPEEKKPEEKPPEPKPQEKPPEKQPEKQQPEKQLNKPPPPQLLQSQVKDHSSTNRKDANNGANGNNIAIALAGEGPILSMRLDQEGAQGPEGSKGPVGEELSQNEQDYVLSQILPFWKVDVHRPEGKGMVLEAIIEINPDGTLQYPLGRDDPWNPNGIIAGYAQMARLGYSYKREALEGFLLALRLSQPIRVPPGGKWPKWMKLRFAFDDL